MAVFKAYDIRGTYPDQINKELAYKIGRAFVTFLNCKTVTVGKDMRNSTEELFKALTQGITDQGANVIDIGLVSTPMAYFASKNAEATIIITASHNPGNYNGFKLCRNSCTPISGETGIKDIEKLVINNQFKNPNTKGTISKKQITNDYVNHIKKFQNHKKYKIVADTANAMGGLVLKQVFENSTNLTHIYAELDGTFPNHEADPLKKENLKDTQDKVKELKADLGLAFDGDADRVFFIDENAEIVGSDLITALISKDYNNETILYDIRSSNITKEIIDKQNKSEMCKVGHSFIKEHMRKTNAAFAGELSGHFYFRDNNFTEDSYLAVIKILNMMTKTDKTLSQLTKELKIYHQSGEINSEVKDKNKVLEQLKQKYKDGKLSELDGIRIDYKDWWFNVRASNTEPLLRLNLETKTKEELAKKTDELLKIIRQ